MEVSKSSFLPFISVVVPVRNEEKFIARTLDYIVKQNYPTDRFEILVVDGRSDDATREVVNEAAKVDSRIRLLDNPGMLSSVARNVGARAASGEIVLYIDGHVYIDNHDLLSNTAALMEEKGVSVLSRPQFLETPDNTFFQQAVSLARRSIIGHGLDSTIYTRRREYVDPTSSGACYRKEVFEQVGFFDEDFDAAEDVEFNYRVGKAGFQSYTSPDIAVFYYPRSNLPALFRQMKRYGAGRFRFIRKHPDALSPGSLAPPIFVTLLTLLLVASPWISLKPLAGLLAVYLLVLLAASIAISVKHGFRLMFALPQILVTVHFGLAWGFISEAFARMIGSTSK